MRYNIMRLYREHETHKENARKLKLRYDGGDLEVLPALNSLRHAQSLCRQYIGQEIVERLREGNEGLVGSAKLANIDLVKDLRETEF